MRARGCCVSSMMSATPSAARISVASVAPKDLHPGQVDMKNSVTWTLGAGATARTKGRMDNMMRWVGRINEVKKK